MRDSSDSEPMDTLRRFQEKFSAARRQSGPLWENQIEGLFNAHGEPRAASRWREAQAH